jgi:hypothetical protein
VSNRSTFLFADLSFVYGVAHILDFEGHFTSYNESATPRDADAIATYADWSAVGDDLVAAMNQFAADQRGKAL